MGDVICICIFIIVGGVLIYVAISCIIEIQETNQQTDIPEIQEVVKIEVQDEVNTEINQEMTDTDLKSAREKLENALRDEGYTLHDGTLATYTMTTDLLTELQAEDEALVNLLNTRGYYVVREESGYFHMQKRFELTNINDLPNTAHKHTEIILDYLENIYCCYEYFYYYDLVFFHSLEYNWKTETYTYQAQPCGFIHENDLSCPPSMGSVYSAPDGTLLVCRNTGDYKASMDPYKRQWITITKDNIDNIEYIIYDFRNKMIAMKFKYFDKVLEKAGIKKEDLL